MLQIEREIQEQPEVIRRLLEAETGNAARIAEQIREFDPAFVLIAARGTSDNAARYAQYLFGIQAGLPVALATPSVHTLYEATPRLGRALVIGISQSGQSTDIRRVLDDASRQGAFTLSLTNHPDSPLATLSHEHLTLHAGEERSVAATKTYTAELAAVALLAGALTQDKAFMADLARLPGWVAETLAFSAPIPDWVERYRYAEQIAVIGRGYNFCTAYEISLKIKELCYITSQEYSEADFRHGPIAMIKPGFPVLGIAPGGRTLPHMAELLHQLGEKQAECLVVSNAPELAAVGKKYLPLPELPEALSPICAVVPGQIFAMSLAAARGHQVDTPQHIQKVTVTT